MLHRAVSPTLAALLLVGGAPVVAAAQPGPGARAQRVPGAAAPLFDPLDAVSREQLRKRLRAATVVVRRSGALPPGMWAPGAGRHEGHGWWLGAGRVVTAAALVPDWPMRDDDTIAVELPDGRQFKAAVGLFEKHLGLAILDVPGLPEPSALAPPADDPLGSAPGRPLYAADGSGLLHRLVVSGPAPGERAYYSWLQGRVALGTPLFDARGRVVTLVGLEAYDSPARSLALPAKALIALLERADWRE